MKTCQASRLNVLFVCCMLVYLAILPISDTIALRNLLLFLLSCTVAHGLLRPRDRHVLPRSMALRILPPVWIAWTVFLLLFPLWAAQPDSAWRNLAGQWGESILAWGVGIGAVLLLGRGGPGLMALAWASAFPIVVHLLLVLAAWAGLLGSPLPDDVPMSALWARLTDKVVSGSWGAQMSFPWGFRGIEPMHGNLGYAACQAVALFGVSAYGAWQERRQSHLWLACTGIALCLLSVLIANSRGALLFAGLLLAVIAVVAYWLARSDRNGIGAETRPRVARDRVVKVGLLLALLSLVLLVAFQAIKKDVRWHTMADRVRVGMQAEQPVDILCNGVSADLEADIRSRFADRGPDYAEALIYGLKIQDGGRIMLMRAGFQLMLEQPWGLDGSRTSYQKIMEAKCGHPPKLHFSHAHQGWIDTSLALGWLGILILMALLVSLSVAGWQALPHSSTRLWGFALLLLGGFWILRGFADSVYREHFLQMQAVLLGYLVLRIRLELAQRARG